jgi:hypothetical protein
MLRIVPLRNENIAVHTWSSERQRENPRDSSGRQSDNVVLLSRLACGVSIARPDAQFGLFASSGANGIFGNPAGCPDGLK